MLSFVALTWCLPRLHPKGEESREEERRVEKGRKPRRSVEREEEKKKGPQKHIFLV